VIPERLECTAEYSIRGKSAIGCEVARTERGA
jgi:hypothetical protein